MKVAISLPDPMFDAAEKLAGELGVSRSQLYATALARFLEERSALAVTESLNAVYSVVPSTMDEAMMRAQMEVLAREAW